jgi:hypothetical protein
MTDTQGQGQQPAGLQALLRGLQQALQTTQPQLASLPLQPMLDKGLAHHHVRLQGSGLIARLPKQSQMGLPAAANLAYEAACFGRAAASGHVPALAGLLPPGPGLPRGGLLVEEIVGRPARLPDDLPAIATALAALHALPLPPVAGRAPLLDAADPLRALQQEIDSQALHLPAAGLHPQALALIARARAALDRQCQAGARPLRRLIAFDAHPGNFLLRADGRAMLVDLEKARYSHPPLDLAHATLYTSTTWDVASQAVLSPQQVADAYATWETAWVADGDLGKARSQRPWFVPLRTAMWLWSVTWCAKWRVLAPRDAPAAADGEDWSQRLTAEALVAHVRDRVDHYLGVPVITQVADELATLQQLFDAAAPPP